jgi:hypothetical protein
MMLDDAQKTQVTVWIEQGLKLAEIQKRLETEFGLRLTYMEVKLLVSDLQVLPKDAEPSRPVDLGAKTSSAPAPASPGAEPEITPLDDMADDLPPAAGRVKVSVDQIARAGAVVSGGVTFSDGKQGTWFLDQTGRLGLAPAEKGYRPPADDLPEFQAALEQELARMGY